MKKQTNYFQQNLVKSNKEIKASRATRVAKQAEMAQEELVRSLEKEVMDIEARIEDLEDLSPGTTTSLNPVAGTFEADSWVNELQTLKINLLNKKVELEVAQNTYEKYFSKIEDKDE